MKKYFNKLYNKSYQNFSEIMIDNLKNDNKMFVITANPETFMIASKDVDFSSLILDKDVTVVPDGIGIVKAAKMLNYEIIERIPGIEIALTLLKEGNKNKKCFYLFGASEEVMKLMEKKIKKEYPNIKLVGYSNGYVEDKDAIFENISKLQPDVILVALGIPAQEKLIYKHLHKFSHGIFVGVGGSFDVISGYKKRAPKLFQKLNLEWLYRLVKEPKRIKRFYNSNVKFIFQIRKTNKNK